jgi:hypothetical protein
LLSPYHRRQHLSAVQNCRLCGTALADNGELCNQDAAEFVKFCGIYAWLGFDGIEQKLCGNYAGISLLARITGFNPVTRAHFGIDDPRRENNEQLINKVKKDYV